MKRANGNEPDTLDPQKYELASEAVILLDLFEGLTTTDSDVRIEAGQAESWTVSADGLTYTFTLREGLKWSDGTPLTAEDFAAGMRRIVDPAVAAKMPDLAFKLKGAREALAGKAAPGSLGVRAIDDRTLELTLDSPSPIMPVLLSTALFMPVPRHVLAAAGERWTKPGTMVSNGAFTLTDWRPSAEIRVSRNPLFRDAASVKLDGVVYLPSDDVETALKRFRAGELDFLPIVPATKLNFVRAEMNDAVRTTPLSQVRYIEVNHRRPALSDARVRRALALLIDRETIAERIMQGSGIAAYRFVPPTVEGYAGPQFDFAAKPMDARKGEAAALLTEAGYGPGNPLKIELRSLADGWARPVAIAVTGMWKEAGIDVSLQTQEARVHYAAVQAGDYDLAISGWLANPDPEFFMWLFETGGSLNASKFENAEFERLSELAGRQISLDDRYRLFAEAEAVLLDQTAMLPLFFTVQTALVNPKVQGLNVTPRGPTRSRHAQFLP